MHCVRIFLLGILVIFQNNSFAINLNPTEKTNSRFYIFSDDALNTSHPLYHDFKYNYSTFYHYLKNPLTSMDGNEVDKELVKEIHSLHLSFTYALSDHKHLFFQTTAASIETDPILKKDGTTVGDSAIGYKWRLTQSEYGAVALIPKLFIPTGNNPFLTNDKVGVSFKVSLEKIINQYAWALNLGYENRPGRFYSIGSENTSIDLETTFLFSFSFMYLLNPKWQINTEFFRNTSLPFSNDQNPSEFYVGTRYSLNPNYSFFSGISIGQFLEKSSNDYRLTLGLEGFRF